MEPSGGKLQEFVGEISLYDEHMPCVLNPLSIVMIVVDRPEVCTQHYGVFALQLKTVLYVFG
jgi:hypothetical protein